MANIGMESAEISKLRQELDRVCQSMDCDICYMKPVRDRYSEKSPEGPESKCDHIHASKKFIRECEKAKITVYGEGLLPQYRSQTISF
jgi:hypothetical protein